MYKTKSCLFIAICLLLGCTASTKIAELGNLNSSKKVLIATENTEFKQEIVDRLTQKLGMPDYYFKVIGINLLPETNTDPYNAILVISKITAGRIQQKTSAYLQNKASDPKLVVLVTSGSGDPYSEIFQTNLKGVDAITSASKMNKVEEITDQIAVLIKKRF